MEKIQIPEINDGQPFFIGRLNIIATEELEKIGKQKNETTKNAAKIIYAILLCSKNLKTIQSKPDPRYYDELKIMAEEFPLSESEELISKFWKLNEDFFSKRGIANPYQSQGQLSDTQSNTSPTTPSNTSAK